MEKPTSCFFRRNTTAMESFLLRLRRLASPPWRGMWAAWGQVVRDGVNGFLLSPDATATDFADVICRVYGDRTYYYQLRCSAKKEYQIRLNWTRWGEMMEQIFQEVIREVKMKESHVYIPTYIINLRRRPDRKKHILREFEGREEFQTSLVEACEHKVGAVGLWMSLRKIVEDAVQRDYDAILICEDDHEFTPQYSKEKLYRHIYGAHRQGAELLSGGIGGFGVAVPTAANRYWVDWVLVYAVHCRLQKTICSYIVLQFQRYRHGRWGVVWSGALQDGDISFCVEAKSFWIFRHHRRKHETSGFDCPSFRAS